MATNAQPIGVIARLLDLSERRVQQLSREGVIPKAERGQYDLVGAVRGYVAYLRDLAVRAQAEAPDFSVERARLIKAKADIAEMEAEGRRPMAGGALDGGRGGPAPSADTARLTAVPTENASARRICQPRRLGRPPPRLAAIGDDHELDGRRDRRPAARAYASGTLSVSYDGKSAE